MLARNVGFDVVQAPTTPDQHIAEEIKSAADKAGIGIDSVMNQAHWEFPLSSSDPATVEKSLAGMRTSLHNAKLWGSDVVLLVPGVVNRQTSYLRCVGSLAEEDSQAHSSRCGNESGHCD